MGMCAVKDCPNSGNPQICFYDGKYHHHGCIHYDCGYPQHSVEFRKDAWYFICDEHYKLLKAEREAWVKAKRIPQGIGRAKAH